MLALVLDPVWLNVHSRWVDDWDHELRVQRLDLVGSPHEARACALTTMFALLAFAGLFSNHAVKSLVPPLDLLLDGSLGGRGLLARLPVFPLHVAAKQATERHFFLYYNGVCQQVYFSLPCRNRGCSRCPGSTAGPGSGRARTASPPSWCRASACPTRPIRLDPLGPRSLSINH